MANTGLNPLSSMSSASTSHPSARFSLASFLADLRTAWAQMQRWPGVAALSPALPVRLLLADGKDAWWSVGVASARSITAPAQGTDFLALELPDDLVLLRTLALPTLEEAELRQAVALDVAEASPFPAEDRVWSFATRPLRAGTLEVLVAIASRRQVAQFIERSASRLPAGQSAEVWALQPPFAPIVLPGYAESRRQARALRSRRLAAALAVLAVGLMLAIAVTPTAQLRLRAIQAVQSMDALVKRTEPAVRQRAALTQTIDAATAMTDLLAQRSQPLQVLNLLTQTLPDDTSLLGLTLDGRKVSINGLTSDAAALMQILSARPEFRDVKAPTPAARPLGSTKDLFTIELTMAPPAGAAQAPAAAAPAGSAPMASASGAVSSSATSQVGAASGPAQGAPAPAAAPAAPQSGGASFGGATFGAPAGKP